jgi:hypothetical protein
MTTRERYTAIKDRALPYIRRDGGRVLLLVAVALGLTLADKSLSAVAFSVGVVLLLAVASHLTRRILAPKLDLQELMATAAMTPIGAAIVALAMIWFIGTLIQAGVALMR